MLVTSNDGSDYPLSPNLRERFSLGFGGMKVINYLGNEMEVSVYMRGISVGK